MNFKIRTWWLSKVGVKDREKMVMHDTILMRLIMVGPYILLRPAHFVSRCDTILVYFCSYKHVPLLGLQISFIHVNGSDKST